MLDSSSTSASASLNKSSDFVLAASLGVSTPETNRCPELPGTLKVLHVINGEHFSGAERVQSHLGNRLPDFGIAADFASVKPGRFSEMLDDQEGHGGRGHRIEMKNRFDLRVVSKLCQLVHDFDYDMLHAHTPRTAMVTSLAARKCGVPWVYHVHSPASRDSSSPWTNWVNAKIEKRSLGNCNHVITVSNSLRDDIIQGGISPSKVTVVHNGVPGIRPDRTEFPVPMNSVGTTAWVIGMIALMRPRKGLEIVLDALKILRDTDHPVKLRVIGPFETEDYRAQIDLQIEALGMGDHIEWLGFTDNVPEELARLDAMVLPSLYGEGLPMVVLEAMAAAVPVIATRVEGTPEAVTDGVEGLLAAPRDATSLADKISDLVSGKHDWHTLSEAAFAKHAAQFSDVAMARGTAEVYARLIR